jgi:hypothetical protein
MLEKFWRFLAWHLPRSLVKWAAVRLGNEATAKFANKSPDEITFLDALNSWDRHD